MNATTLRYIAPPPDLRVWTRGAVSVRLTGALASSSFPASLGGMLVLRQQGLAFQGTGELLPAAALIGPSAEALHFEQEGPLSAVGLLLEPQAVMLISGMPNRYSCGQSLALQDLPLAATQTLSEQVAYAESDQQRCELLFRWLRQHIAWDTKAATKTLAAGELSALLGLGLDEARRQLGISARQLERRSLTLLGMSPKRAHAVLRMQSVLTGALHQPKSRGGAELALQHGYYDQSHMARDLRGLAGAPLQRLLEGSAAAQDSYWSLKLAHQLALA